jgi:hypothetical protein
MSSQPFARLGDTYGRADQAYRRARYRPPGALWRYEAEHPVRVNLTLVFVYLLLAILIASYWWGVAMAGCSLWRIVSWHRGGYTRRHYERQVQRAMQGPPDHLR